MSDTKRPVRRRVADYALRAGSFLCGAGVIAGMVLSAYAAWEVQSDTQNYLNTPSFGVETREDWKEPVNGVFPGQDVTKKVTVANVGTTPELVRVKLTKLIGHKGEDGVLVPDESLDPDKLILDVGGVPWEYRDEDGYWYYKDVLKPGEVTSELLHGFRLDEGAGSAYERLDCQIIVNTETCQYEGNGIQAWGLSYSVLGIAEPVDVEGDVVKTEVTFISPEEKFDIEISKTDLFANFKDLHPGITRYQTIGVNNHYTEDVELSVACMEADSAYSMPETPEAQSKVYEMMMEHIDAEITDADGNMLYEGPVGGGENCSLPIGTVKAGSSFDLTVKITVDPEMGNEFMDLAGRVRWQFVAKQVDKPDDPVKSWMVQTSELNLLKAGLAILCAGLAGVAVFAVIRKYRGKD